MKLDVTGFKKVDGEYRFGEVIPTLVGDFLIELENKPTEERVAGAQAFVDQVLEDLDEVMEYAWSDYKRLCKDDPGWLADNDCEVGLGREEFGRHVDGGLITVADDEDGEEDGPFRCRVVMYPQWDEEHNLYLAYVDDDWEEVDC